jgi:hypothetical protein
MDLNSLIHERLPVWTALSEFFLDTELQDEDFKRIATVLDRSPYNRAEIEGILKEEVSPAFAGNLLSIVGEWAPWSQTEVREIMERSIRTRLSNRPLDRLRAKFARRIIPPEWHRTAAELNDH